MKLSNFLHDLTTAMAIFDLDYNCFSKGQLKSKEWLIEVLDDIRRVENIHLGIIYVLCGWYGILPAMLFLKFEMIPRIRSFDINPECERIADQINKTYSSNNWKFKAIIQDIHDINFEKHSWKCWSNKNNRMSRPLTDTPTTIINTSCEHTGVDWFHNIPGGKFVILQSNDSLEEEGHINPMTDLEEFTMTYPLNTIYYRGVMNFNEYKRFMLIGVK
jgi:hypothetical protein